MRAILLASMLMAMPLTVMPLDAHADVLMPDYIAVQDLLTVELVQGAMACGLVHDLDADIRRITTVQMNNRHMQSDTVTKKIVDMVRTWLFAQPRYVLKDVSCNIMKSLYHGFETITPSIIVG